MRAKPNTKPYRLTEAESVPKEMPRGKSAPRKKETTECAPPAPKAKSNGKGFTFITEKVPNREGYQRSNVYDSAIESFVRGRAKNVRVLMDTRSPKAMMQGLSDAIKRTGAEGVKAHSRTVEGELRVYLSKN